MSLSSFIEDKKKALLVILVIFLLIQNVYLLFYKKDGFTYSRESSQNPFENLIEAKYNNNEFSTLLRKIFDAKNESKSFDGFNAAVDENLQKYTVKPKFVITFEKQNLINDLYRYGSIKQSNLNIFFIESKCGTKKSAQNFENSSTFLLSARQCCSVESAATLNPGREVYILHTCPLSDGFFLRAPAYARTLLGLPNVHVVPVDMATLLKDSPVEELFISGRLEESLYPVVHASDIIRLVILWRFGGTYCDLDIMSLRSLDGLVPSNFCGVESNKAIGNSILNFDPHGYGHELLTRILQHVNTNFHGSIWAANGPELITKTVLQECNANIQTVTNCSVFTVYSQNVLYPVLWKDYLSVFNPYLGTVQVERLKETGFTVHFWNNFTRGYKVQVGSPQPYALLANEFCPNVYRNCGQEL